MTLRRLARQIRQQDPELARLLSGSSGSSGGGRLRPLRFTSVPATGYALVGAALVVAGLFLGVGSAVFWGVVALAAAALRRNVARRAAPSRRPPGPDRDLRDRWGSR